MSVTSFGVSGLTPITMSATTSDPDGDPVSLRWEYLGTVVTQPSFTTTLSGDGVIPVTLIAIDSRGLATTSQRTVTIGNMTGTWNYVPTTGAGCGVFGLRTPPVLTLEQRGKVVQGTIYSPGAWCNVPGGTSGTLDPAGGNEIDAEGNFKGRLKIPGFVDGALTARMDATGRELTGTRTNIDLAGSSTFWLRKQ